MRNKVTTIKKALLSLAFVAAAAGLVWNAGTVNAIPYVPGDQSNASPIPAFNVFTGVPNQGSESDFLRARVPTSDNDVSTQYVDPLNTSCAVGQKIQMRVYVHNGAGVNGNVNGTGPSVAHGTKVKVSVPGTEATSFVPSATISADNAATVTDNVTINCSGQAVKLDYLEGSAQQYSLATGLTPVNDSIVTTGAPISSHGVAGDVWGCFDQRVYVILTVEVKALPPPVSSGECKVADLAIINKEKREVRVTVTGEVNNATIVGYKIDWGDGTSSDKQTDTHQYSENKAYTITTQVQIRLADGTVVWKTAEKCKVQIAFEAGQPPKVVPVTPAAPPVLPNTGAGAVIATFVGVSSLSSGLYYLARRKFSL